MAENKLADLSMDFAVKILKMTDGIKGHYEHSDHNDLIYSVNYGYIPYLFALGNIRGWSSMKKNFVIIFLFAVLLASCLILTSCHNHEVSEWTEIYDLTCVRAGTGIGFCECGEQITKEIQPIGHQYVNRVCSVCGDLEGSSGLQIMEDEDGVSASVVGIGTCTDTDIIIPSTYVTDDNRFLEVSICSRAFENCTNITSITIPNNVSIASDAFEGCTIEKATMSVGAFGIIKNNSNLKEIVITSTDDFWDTNMIPEEWFRDCVNLTSVTICEGIKRIGNYAFYGCSNLTNVTIPSSVTDIDNSAFSNCTSLSSITLPESITGIGHFAFYGCTSLSNITIPEGVIGIGQRAFSGCTNLTSITIPSSVTSLFREAFANCTGLTSVTFAKNSKLTNIENNTFENCTNLTNVTIGEGVTSISGDAFSGCSNLNRIIIPSSVTSIDNSAFFDSKYLTIYCRAQSKPEGWGADWNSTNSDFYDETGKLYADVVWGYQGE